MLYFLCFHLAIISISVVNATNRLVYAESFARAARSLVPSERASRVSRPLVRGSSVMPVIAITLTVLSACAINVGKGIQKKASKSLPKLSLASLRSYLTDPNWRRGLELDVIGGAGMLLALSIAPMSVVQPASASGVAILAVVSHAYLGESLTLREWKGVASCGFGIAVLSKFARGGGETRALGAFRLMVAIGLGFACLATPSVISHRFRSGASASAAKRYELIKIGAQCGTCFALSAFSVKAAMGFLYAWRLFSAPIAFGVSGTLTAMGLYFQTAGFREAGDVSIVVVCVAGNVAQMFVAALYGLIILSEPLPETIPAFIGWIMSWVFITYGVVALSGADSASSLVKAREVRGAPILPTAIGPGAMPPFKTN